MANPPAISPNTTYHIFNRGNNRENLFREEHNYAYFLLLYLKHVSPFVKTYAFCLLRNHFHLLVRVLDPKVLKVLGISITPSQQFATFFNAYTKGMNKSYARTGSLFQNPFKRLPVTSTEHFLAVTRYIHMNPQNHGLIDDFRAWTYSSYIPLTSGEQTFLASEDVFSIFGGKQAFIRLHNEFPAEDSLLPLPI